MNCRGFTLIEAMIVITIMALLVAMGAPAMTQYVANARIRSAADQVHSALTRARTEAIKRNGTIVFQTTNTGWTIATDDPGITAEAVETEDGFARGSVAMTYSVPTIEFTGFGRTLKGASLVVDVKNAQFACSSDCASGVRCLRITVASGGQVRLCDPASPTGSVTGC